jgi:hypothetical protein
MQSRPLAAWTRKDTNHIVAAVIVWLVGLSIAFVSSDVAGGVFVGICFVMVSCVYVGAYLEKRAVVDTFESDIKRLERQPPTFAGQDRAGEIVDAVRGRLGDGLFP